MKSWLHVVFGERALEGFVAVCSKRESASSSLKNLRLLAARRSNPYRIRLASQNPPHERNLGCRHLMALIPEPQYPMNLPRR